ncbi:MAG: hypothetical protein MRJ93_10240 [Nitrososphaeraceae archaeon]|nr:hypothetical protein [Nitrososphaeraceae archaeon]
MNKIKNIKLFVLLSFSVTLTTIILVSTTTSIQSIYSEDDINGKNLGKFFTSPILSLQQASSGTISQINSTAYLLQLNDVSDKTISFKDRPYRNVTSLSTEYFVDVWNMLKGAEESYAKVPPNAALIVDEIQKGELEQDTVVIELYNPVYNEDTKILRYDFTVVDNSTFSDLPLDIGQSALLIDGAYAGQSHGSTR